MRPGIYFADDPVFKGRPRELTAADYVYSFKRFFDPAIPTEHLYMFENEKVLGLSELRRRAISGKTRFGCRQPSRRIARARPLRLEIRLAAPSPRFVLLFAQELTGAVAREVVEHYGDEIMAHPVGTGPFVLTQWRRGSRIVIGRNPGFRVQPFESSADDAQSQFIASSLQGRSLPLLDRIEIAIIEEDQPRWLAFLRDELDMLTLPSTYASMAMPHGQLAPFLAQRGVLAHTALVVVARAFFNFDDPLVGGYTPEKVALRRAVALTVDSSTEIRVLQQGQAIAAQSLRAATLLWIRSSAQERDERRQCRSRQCAARPLRIHATGRAAVARRQTDGRPLTLRLASTQDHRARQRNELWKKRFDAVGLQLQVEVAGFGELIKRALAGQLVMWGFTWSAQRPMPTSSSAWPMDPTPGQSNDALRLAGVRQALRASTLATRRPGAAAAIRQATKLMLAYAPYIPHTHAVSTVLTQSRVRGLLLHPFVRDEVPTWSWSARPETLWRGVCSVACESRRLVARR